MDFSKILLAFIFDGSKLDPADYSELHWLGFILAQNWGLWIFPNYIGFDFYWLKIGSCGFFRNTLALIFIGSKLGAADFSEILCLDFRWLKIGGCGFFRNTLATIFDGSKLGAADFSEIHWLRFFMTQNWPLQIYPKSFGYDFPCLKIGLCGFFRNTLALIFVGSKLEAMDFSEILWL